MLGKEEKEIFLEYYRKLTSQNNEILKEYKTKLDILKNIKLIGLYKAFNIQEQEEKYEYLSNLYFSNLDQEMSEVDIYLASMWYKSYIDNNGYRRYFKNDKLVHRTIAELYLYDKNKYDLKFYQYVIHHKNMDKLNNSISNLEILTQPEHEAIHTLNFYENEDEEDDDEYKECEMCGRQIKSKYSLCYECNKKYNW